MQYKTAIVGPQDTISGLKLLGAVPFPANSGHDALEILKDLVEKTTTKDSKEKYAVIIIMENILNDIPAGEYSKLTEGSLPAIVSIPGLEGSSGASLSRLKELTKRAVGSDILG